MEKKNMGVMVVFVSLVMMIPCVDAVEKKPDLYIVGHYFQGWGGDDIFTNPFDYNGWSNQHHFYVGDWLFFGFNPYVDSVLVVNETDYNACRSVDPIEYFAPETGQVLFNLSSAQTYYFITGGGINARQAGAGFFCGSNLKLKVIVLDTEFYQPRDAPPAEAPSTSPPAEICVCNSGRNIVSTVIGIIAVACTLVWVVWI